MASSPLYPPPEQQSYQTTPGPANPAIPPSPSSYGTTQPPPPPPKTHSDAHAPARATSTSSWDAGDQPYPPRRTSSRRPDSASWRGGGTVVADRARRYSRGGYYEGEEYAQSAGDAYRAEQPGRQSYAPQYPDERYEMGEDEGSGPYNRDGVQELGEPRPQDGLGDKLMFPPEGWVPEILPDKSKSDLHHILSNPELLKSLLNHPDHRPPILSRSIEQLNTELSHTSDLASQTSALAARLTATRAATSERLLKVRGLEQQWHKKQQWMESRIEGRMGPRVLHGRLVAAIGEAERMGEGVIVAGLEARDGEMATERDVEDWIQKVKEERRLVWLRKERRARWDEGRVGGWR